MGNVMTYSGLTTKVRAMQAKLLTHRDFENIANLRSVPEAIEYLKGYYVDQVCFELTEIHLLLHRQGWD